MSRAAQSRLWSTAYGLATAAVIPTRYSILVANGRERSAFKAFPASLSLQPGFLAPKFLGTNRASPKHAIIAFFDLHEAANTAIES